MCAVCVIDTRAWTVKCSEFQATPYAGTVRRKVPDKRTCHEKKKYIFFRYKKKIESGIHDQSMNYNSYAYNIYIILSLRLIVQSYVEN